MIPRKLTFPVPRHAAVDQNVARRHAHGAMPAMGVADARDVQDATMPIVIVVVNVAVT
jgi:hypothetical protein